MYDFDGVCQFSVNVFKGYNTTFLCHCLFHDRSVNMQILVLMTKTLILRWQLTTVVPLFKLPLNLLSFNSYLRFCIKTAVIMHKQNQNLQQNEVIMYFCMIKTGTKLTDIKIWYMYEYLYFDMYILFLCRSLTHSLMWLIKRRLIDGLLLQLPLLRWQKTWRKEKECSSVALWTK